MIVMVVIVFVFSWFFYCFVSFIVVFIYRFVLVLGEVEVFELLVKVFVIYNFIVYIIMNSRF